MHLTESDAAVLCVVIRASVETPETRRNRDAKVTQIYDGTCRIQRVVIARDRMKKGARG